VIAHSPATLDARTEGLSDRLDARGSVSWRINAERLALFGWGRAILLQLAHPLIAAGVFEHSGFRSAPHEAARRLSHTVSAMLSLTFGDRARRERALDGIRTIHRRVHGQLTTPVGPFPAGTPYSAEDPALVLWVHATLVESVLLVYERLVRPLTLAERDAYCREAAPTAVALLAREADVPRSWTELRAYLEETSASGAIIVSPQARALGHAVLSPSGAWPLAPATWANRVMTAGLLPPAIRIQYELPWTARHERTFERLAQTLRAARRITPHALATWRDSREPRT